MPRLALAAVALAATTLLTAAAPKPRPMAPPEPAPAGLAPPAEEAVIAGSCRIGPEQCLDFEGAFTPAELQARCQGVKGTPVAAVCPAEGRVGSCTVRETGTDDRVLTRFYPPATEKKARAECKKQPRGVYLAR
ncbi:MAG: hypothetical protein NDI82_08420 [Anaeromyxobacteraceae bacterium]|nr:hypothetical protein [Anaeromyxobacteraceae bacterium]